MVTALLVILAACLVLGVGALWLLASVEIDDDDWRNNP